MSRVLIVDDDRELAEMLQDYLGGEGFEVALAFDGESGAQQALEGACDAVILDVMMPKLGGMEALKRIRASSQIPVLMLTARGDEIDRTVGLEIGADDYLPKPFNPRELTARLRAVLRRTKPQSGVEGALEAGRLVLFPAARRVEVEGDEIELTSTEYSLLEVLVRHKGQVVRKEILSEEGLGRKLGRYDRSIDMHLSNLRRKLDPDQVHYPRILTVRGVGYQLALSD